MQVAVAGSHSGPVMSLLLKLDVRSVPSVWMTEVTSTASLALFYNVAVASAIALVLIFVLRPAALARMKRLLRPGR